MICLCIENMSDNYDWREPVHSGPPKKIRLKAPAKINLNLHILSKRPDGYHELSTRMQKLELSDDVELVRRSRPGISIECNESVVPGDQSNLAWRAAEVFWAETSGCEECGVGIQLRKNIPVAAGLGGGSSDAGAVLKGLNILFEKRMAEEKLIRMAKMLGADVPFFVTDYNAVVATGVGDRMVEVDSLEGCRVILLNLGISVSTRWAYENFALTRASKTFKKGGFRNTTVGSFPLQDMYNDLEQVTIKRHPEIGEVKKTMLALGAEGAMMSGSGPTVFGVFREISGKRSSDFEMIAKELKSRYGGKVFVTKIAG